MGKVVTLRANPPWDLRRIRIRDDVSDLVHMLVILKECESGAPVAKSAVLPIDLEKLAPFLGITITRVAELGGVRLGNPWAERDIRVSGLFDRARREIVIANNEPIARQRVTIAHEMCHLLYHSGALQLRERVARGIRSGKSMMDEGPSKLEEREAEIFAIELVMPTDLTEEAMIKRFGGRIDGTLPHDELAYHLSLATGRKIQPRQLSGMPQEARAGLFAQANNFRGSHFKPLIELFSVSLEAMAIRLLELGLVS